MSGEIYIPRKLEVCMATPVSRYVCMCVCMGKHTYLEIIGMYVCLGKHTYLENYRYVCMSGETYIPRNYDTWYVKGMYIWGNIHT